MASGNVSRSGSFPPQQLLPAVKLRVRTFDVPVVRDGAVIGVHAPITSAVLVRILQLTTRETFVAHDIRDDVIASIVVREAILRKTGWPRIHDIVHRDIRQLMSKNEILALHFEIELGLAEVFERGAAKEK